MSLKWKIEKVSNKKFELVSKGIALLMSMILIGILSFKELIPIIISREYTQVIYIFPFLLLYPIFYTMSETTTLGISFSRKTGYNIIVSAISMLINLILNTLLIPIYGAVGAAIATGISYLVFFWTRTIISRKLWYKFPLKHFVFVTIVLMVVAICNTIIKNILITTAVNILSAILIIYNYREILYYIINKVKKKRYKIFGRISLF